MSVQDFSKKLLHPGKGVIPIIFKKNAKAVFHFRTIVPPDNPSPSDDLLVEGAVVLDDSRTIVPPDNPSPSDDLLVEGAAVLDDSRTMGTGPFELLIGREFKMSVWEELVKTMRIGEVARFTCPYEFVIEYPRVSKALRDLAKQKAGQDVPQSHQHTCSLSAMQGTGHSDLDKLGETHTPLVFEFELLRVEQSGDYKKEHWAMTDKEKQDAIPRLREEGNTLYKDGRYLEASEKYFEALSYLEQMSIKEKPQSDSWNAITVRKIPFLLNYAQCQLLLKEYAEVIRHTTTVLDFEADNVKALFRRGKAHSASWNVEEAREDFDRVVKLDPSLAKTIDKALKSLTARLKEKEQQERDQLRGKMF